MEALPIKHNRMLTDLLIKIFGNIFCTHGAIKSVSSWRVSIIIP